MKTLASGLVVNADQYYKLLEWKDNNLDIFIIYCQDNKTPFSINEYTKQQYEILLKYAKIDLI